jgi:hypothetical protein
MDLALQLKLLSMVHSKYLVALVSYFLAPKDHMLVYEYIK